MFFALKGENFNGNEFAEDALKRGAAYSIVEEEEYAVAEKCILVDNVLIALQTLATYHVRQLNIPVIAITGSNGKTTTKELVSAVLSKKYNVHATKGNLNNHIGVPLTILSMERSAEMLVIELGANHVGEIGQLCLIAQPSFGLITNIGKAHLEGFGSLEGVVKAKGELYEHITEKEGLLFVNGSDDRLLDLSQGTTRILYGSDESNDCVCSLADSNPYLKIKWIDKTKATDGENIISSKILGEYNFDNIVAAISIGDHFEVTPSDIKAAVEEYLPSNNRSQIIDTNNNKIVLDAYNANPMNMKAALESFFQMEGENKVLILGDMLELGDYAAEEHRVIAKLIQEQNINNVLLVGENFGKLKDAYSFVHFRTSGDAAKYLTETPLTDSLVLIKGSRGIGLESLVELL